MTGKEALLKIGNLIKSAFAEEAPAAIKLADGTEVQSTLEPGSPVAFVGADGAVVPAAVGEYELEDARILVVTEEGVVAEVREAAPATEEEMKQDNPAPAPAAFAAVESELATTKAELSAVKADFADHKATSAKFQSDTGELVRQMYALLELLTKEEDGKPADEPKQTAFAAKRAEKAEAREKMLGGFKKFAERIKK